jgi:hypothetical protein
MANAGLTSTTRGDISSGNASSDSPKDPACIAEAEGKAVKVISQLLLSLPANHEYRVIFMQRPLHEVMASQDEMLRRRGTFDPSGDNSVVSRAFVDHLYQVGRLVQ